MTYPKTIWSYSKTTEALRILQIAYHIKNNFYQKKGFFVLPYNISQNPRVIFFPKLNYKKITNFWKKVKNNSEDLLNKKDPIVEEIVRLLPENDLDYSQQKKEWEKVEKNFWKKCFCFLPSYFNNIKTLEIRPTKYGSIATGYSTWMKDNKKIVVYVRCDADFSHIVEGIFIDRFYKKLGNLYNWEEIEAIIDFLLIETELGKIFNGYKKTLKFLRQFQQGKLAKNSDKYLRFLGIYNREIFKIKEKEIFVNNQKPFPKFSLMEEKIMRLLINKKKEIVSFDEIANIIWGKEFYDDFSMFAITKIIQRLREKIRKIGISPEVIQTIRKEGYLLID